MWPQKAGGPEYFDASGSFKATTLYFAQFQEDPTKLRQLLDPSLHRYI